MVPADTVSNWKLAGHYGRTTGRTHSVANGEILKIATFSSQTVQIRYLKGFAAMTTSIAIAPIIREDEDNIGVLPL